VNAYDEIVTVTSLADYEREIKKIGGRSFIAHSPFHDPVEGNWIGIVGTHPDGRKTWVRMQPTYFMGGLQKEAYAEENE
jgi:hypothetical protein